MSCCLHHLQRNKGLHQFHIKCFLLVYLFSCYCTMYKTGSIILYRNTLSQLFFLNSLVQVFSILPKLQLKPMTSLFNGKCKERMPLGQMTSFQVKIKFDFIGNLIAKTHSNVSFLKTYGPST